MLRTAVWLVMAAAIAAPGLLLFAGWYVEFRDEFCFLGGCGHDSDAGVPYFRAAAVTGVGMPIIGIGLSFVSRQIAPRVVLGMVVTITLVSIWISNIEVREIPENDWPRPCQEHSGGDTTCPGG